MGAESPHQADVDEKLLKLKKIRKKAFPPRASKLATWLGYVGTIYSGEQIMARYLFLSFSWLKARL